MGLLRLGGMPCKGIGVLCVVMVLVVLSPPWIPGTGGFSQTCMFSLSGCFDALDILHNFTGQVVVSRKDAGSKKWAKLASGEFRFLVLCLTST